MEAAVFRALGSPARLAIVDLLANGGRCVRDIAKGLSMDPALTSRHLARMYSAGLLRSRRDKQRVYYTLISPYVQQLLSSVRDLLRHNVRAAAPQMPEASSLSLNTNLKEKPCRAIR